MATETTETRTRPGRCPIHGEITAEKVLPRLRFPYVVFATWRAIASLRPYRCPSCGARAAVARASA